MLKGPSIAPAVTQSGGRKGLGRVSVFNVVVGVPACGI